LLPVRTGGRVPTEVHLRLFIFVVALVLVSGPFAPAFCQGALEPTSVVAVGQKVTIRTSSGEPVRGRVTKVTKAGILIDAGKKQGTLQVSSSDIVKIGRPSRGKGALIGALVGFGIGFPWGCAIAGDVVDQNNPSIGSRMGVGTIMGGFIGGIGAGIGVGVAPDKTVYRRR
jgi:hypothetical protein